MPLLALEMERKNEMEFHALSDHDEKHFCSILFLPAF